MNLWDTDASAVRVRGGRAAGITLLRSDYTSSYSCVRKTSKREIRQFQREYENLHSMQMKIQRVKNEWVAELKLAELRERAISGYNADLQRAIEWSRDVHVNANMAPFVYGRREEFIDSVRATTESTEDGSALVSMVFCHPQSIVFRDLKHGYTYLDHRSGVSWDLYFVGYSCLNPWNRMRPSKWGVPLWQFSPHGFDEIRSIVQRKHLRALYSSHESERLKVFHGWRYSGNPELVSFMAYRDYPEVIDWLSLRAVRLVDANGNYLAQSLGEVVEVMSDWREDREELRNLAPGESPVVSSVLPIGRALSAVGAALGAGVAGNAAYELIKSAIGL